MTPHRSAPGSPSKASELDFIISKKSKIGRPSGGRAGGRTGGRTDERTDGRAGGRSSGRTDGRAVGRTDVLSGEHIWNIRGTYLENVWNVFGNLGTLFCQEYDPNTFPKA